LTESKFAPTRVIAVARIAWISLTVLIVVLVGLGISDLHESFSSGVDARSIDALNLSLMCMCVCMCMCMCVYVYVYMCVCVCVCACVCGCGYVYVCV